MKRPMRSTSMLLVALAMGSAAAGAQRNSIFESGDHLWVVGDIQVPSVADTFALLRINRYPDLNLGVSLVYGGPSYRDLDLTLYIYPPRVEVDDPVRFEYDLAVRGVHEYAARRPPRGPSR